MLKSHTLVPERSFELIRHELRPSRDPKGRPVPGLYNAWIAIDNPSQLNSYTTDMVKELILAFRQVSMDRRVVACVFTGNGRQGVLHRRQHPRVRRVLRGQSAGVQAVHAALQRHDRRDPALRQAGHQPRQRHADRGRAGDRHGLRLHHRCRHRALRSGGTEARIRPGRRLDRLPSPLCRLRARHGECACYARHGARTRRSTSDSFSRCVPAYRFEGRWIPNPMVITDRIVDDFGNLVFGDLQDRR